MEKEDPQNGTYIGLTPKGDPQAWGGREGMVRRGLNTSTTLRIINRDLGFQERDREELSISPLWLEIFGGQGVDEGNMFLVSNILYCMFLILALESYLKSRSTPQKKFDIHSKTVCRGLLCCLVKSFAESYDSLMSRDGDCTLWWS